MHPYQAEISRTNPTCFLFLVDRSESMGRPIAGGDGRTKAQGVADCINRMLYQLVMRCVWGNEVLDRFHVGVLGYGTGVTQALGGPLAGQDLVPIGELARNPLRVEEQTVAQGTGQPERSDAGEGSGARNERRAPSRAERSESFQVVRHPVWFDPIASGRTPMVQALQWAFEIVDRFIHAYPYCFPPMVMNLTDGEATDGDPEMPAAQLQQLSSEDGNVLLFNLHMSSKAGGRVEFPDEELSLPSRNAQRLFRMSSVLPHPMRESASRAGLAVSPRTRGFVFNADLNAVIRFLDIGTRVDFRNMR